jgi:hypothetical protein
MLTRLHAYTLTRLHAYTLFRFSDRANGLSHHRGDAPRNAGEDDRGICPHAHVCASE